MRIPLAGPATQVHTQPSCLRPSRGNQNRLHCGHRAAQNSRRLRRSRLRAATVEELEGADKDSWKACQAQVQEIGFSEEEADKFLTKAFAWKKGYWAAEKKQPEVPSTEQVQMVIDFLAELGIKEGDLKATVSKFPEVLGLSKDKHLQPNVNVLQYEYKLKGPAMTNVFKRKPQVLGNNFNCYGDCAGNCTRCWTQF